MNIQLASDLQPDSIVDGSGIRTVIWTQGCSHNCPGCHNPGTHDFKGGFSVSVDEVCQALDTLKNQDGITLSGGDPMFQAKQCLSIAKHAKEIGLNVWCFTGFLFEDLIKTKEQKDLLKYIDVLVDGKFDMNEFSLNLQYRGSRNQRIIDVKKSLEKEEVVLIDKYLPDKDYTAIYKKPEYIFI